MSRARLRSKTGCLRCRQRKKKCDEMKPECDACRRCGFNCVWPSTDNRSTVDNIISIARAPEALSRVDQPITGHGFPRFQDQTEFSLLRSFETVHQALVVPIGHVERIGLARHVTVALEEVWCRASLTTFTAHILSANSTDQRLASSALASYNSAVSHVRDRLKSHGLLYRGKDLMSIMIAIILLAFTQGLGTDNSSPPLSHYNVVAENGKKYFHNVTVKSVFPFIRLMLEIVVHHFACMAMFRSVPEVAHDITRWMENSALFISPSSTVPRINNLSPEFAGTAEFFQLVLAVTNYNRREGNGWADVSHINGILSKLDFLEEQLHSCYQGAPKHVTQPYISKYQLFAIGIRIFCLKARKPNLEPRATEVVQLVGRAVQIFSSGALQENHNIGLTWSLAILLCASSDQLTFGFFSRQIDKIECDSERGYFKDLKNVRSILSHSFESVEEDGRREGQALGLLRYADNLHLLLCKDGILSTFQHDRSSVIKSSQRSRSESSRTLSIRDIVD